MSYKIDSKQKYTVDNHIAAVHDYGVDVKANHIYLSGSEEYAPVFESAEPGVEYIMATKFIKNMNFLMRNAPDTPVLIHMKTNGGSWEEGMAIHNLIKSCPTLVTILNYTHARSMSSIIFQAANKRVMMPDSHFMFHEGTYGYEGTVKQVRSAAAFDKRTEIRMLDIYIESMKRKGKFKDKSEKWIKEMLQDQMNKKEDVYLTAEEAVEWGLADEIFGKTISYDWGLLTKYTEEELQRG